MESKNEIVEVICDICKNKYKVELRTEDSCKDDFEKMFRSLEKTMINRAKCDKCIEAEELKENESIRLEALEKKLRAIPFSTSFDRSKTSDNSALAEWAWSNRNKHLWISGDYGCGKTRAICNNLGLLTKQGRKCKYITCNEFLSRYGHKSSESGKISADAWLEKLLQNDFLVIDDIGKKKISLSGGEGLYNLLDYLYTGRGNAKIYLSANLSGVEIVRKFEDSDTGEAFRSRLLRLEFLQWNAKPKFTKNDRPVNKT